VPITLHVPTAGGPQFLPPLPPAEAASLPQPSVLDRSAGQRLLQGHLDVLADLTRQSGLPMSQIFSAPVVHAGSHAWVPPPPAAGQGEAHSPVFVPYQWRDERGNLQQLAHAALSRLTDFDGPTVVFSDIDRPDLEREFLTGLSGTQFLRLEGLLPSADTKPSSPCLINGDTERLILPRGESFVPQELGQVAIFAGIARQKACPEIAVRDDAIVDSFAPEDAETPSVYFSQAFPVPGATPEHERQEFWHNTVGWPGVAMRPQETPPKAWHADDARHSDTVSYALRGTPDQDPAFREVHFLVAHPDPDTGLQASEWRLSQTPRDGNDGRRMVYRPTTNAAGQTEWAEVARSRIPGRPEHA
jgi:hypothetical protein